MFVRVQLVKVSFIHCAILHIVNDKNIFMRFSAISTIQIIYYALSQRELCLASDREENISTRYLCLSPRLRFFSQSLERNMETFCLSSKSRQEESYYEYKTVIEHFCAK
jgi:hypothetical protein